MLPPVWCASHVVGEKPSQAVWDRPWVHWEGCRPCRATGWASATSQETHGEDGNLPKGPRAGPKPLVTASLRPHGLHTIRVAAWHLELLFGGLGRNEDVTASA